MKFKEKLFQKLLLKLEEDLRKVVVAMMVTSLIGVVLLNDKVSAWEAMALFFVAIIIWLAIVLKVTPIQIRENKLNKKNQE